MSRPECFLSCPDVMDIPYVCQGCGFDSCDCICEPELATCHCGAKFDDDGGDKDQCDECAAVEWDEARQARLFRRIDVWPYWVKK